MNTFKFAGLYQFETFSVDDAGNEIAGSRRVILPWFDNLIVDAGLDHLGTTNGDLIVYCRIGTSNTPPTTSDTTLGGQVGSTFEVGVGGATGWASSNAYAYRRVSKRFPAGTISGINLAEVGMAPSATGPLFSKSLLKDTGGTPTTITLGSSDVLDVLYELRVYVNLTPIASTVTIDGVSNSVTIAPIGWGGGSWLPGAIALGPLLGVGTVSMAQRQASSPTEVYTTTPSPANAPFIGTKVLNTYTAGSFQRTATYTFDLPEANFGTGIGGFRYGKSDWVLASADSEQGGLGQFAVSFSPKLNKTSSRTANITVGVSWGRHTP